MWLLSGQDLTDLTSILSILLTGTIWVSTRAFSEDSILNGAVDNATGTAALLEIAGAFTSLPEKQDRSVLFLSVTCEEQGLLGSKFYSENPISH